MRINQMNFSSENAHASVGVAYLSLPIIFPNIFSAIMETSSGRCEAEVLVKKQNGNNKTIYQINHSRVTRELRSPKSWTPPTPTAWVQIIY